MTSEASWIFHMTRQTGRWGYGTIFGGRPRVVCVSATPSVLTVEDSTSRFPRDAKISGFLT
jgi:hypothetical protein